MSIAATSSSIMSYLPIASAQSVKPSGAQGMRAQGMDASAPPPPPKGADNRAKMEALLAKQVQSGNITQDQASTLSTFFADLAKQMNGTQGQGGPDAASGARGAGKGPPPSDNDGDSDAGRAEKGPPPPPPASGGAASSATSSSDAAASADSTTSSTLADALDAFMSALKKSQSGVSGYGASTTSTASASASSLFVDKQV